MNLLKNGIKIKKGDLKIQNKKDGLYIENFSNKPGVVVFSNILRLNNNVIKFDSRVDVLDGIGCDFKLLNIKFKVINTFTPNEIIYESSTNKRAFFGISVRPNSVVLIKKINLEISKQDEKNNQIKKYFKGDTLLICPGYPSYQDKYNCAFIHTRVKEYKRLNMNIDIAHVNDEFLSKTIFSNFEGINVIRTGFSDIRKVLRNKKYKKILIHFFNERHAQILDSLNLIDTQLYFYLHGAETLYWDWPLITTPYFSEYKEISDKDKKLFYLRDEIIRKYNNLTNVHWMFVTPWTKQRSEELLNIKYKNSDIIPCYVDDKIFNYTKKDPELRKKIFILRPFKNVATYATDIDVLVILELSRRKIFKDLEFDIYGSGEMFDIVTEPVKKFENVHLHNEFLTHTQISEMHKKHGIGLFATRYDSQAISCCEAALSGCVVVSTNNPGIKQEIYEKYNTLCNQENYKEYADVIERLYNNPSEFLKISESMSKDINNIYNYDKTIGKELKIFEKNEKENVLKLKEPNKNPILTVLIPAYNVSEYIDSTIFSLLNNKYAHELEILVINDGSRDETYKLAKRWEKFTIGSNRSIVRVIDKKNGGHGSVINLGIKEAKGKYLRILDGDDTFDFYNFELFIEKLKKSKADLILTDLVNDYEITNTINRNNFYSMLKENVTYHFEDLCYEGYGFDEWAPVLSTSTYKTEKLKIDEIKLTEKMPYDDMEFNLLALRYIDTVEYYKLYVYNYLLGRPGQSVSDSALKRNCDKHRIITMSIIDKYEKLSNNISNIRKRFLKNKIVCNMINSQYVICSEYFVTGKKFRTFNKLLKKYPELYKDALDLCDKANTISKRKLKIHRIFNGYDILPLSIYNKIKKIMKSLVRK